MLIPARPLEQDRLVRHLHRHQRGVQSDIIRAIVSVAASALAVYDADMCFVQP